LREKPRKTGFAGSCEAVASDGSIRICCGWNGFCWPPFGAGLL